MEIWKDIDGFDGDYQVSSYGRIKSLKKNVEKILKTHTNKKTGYAYVGLCKDGKVFTNTVHRIVAEAFIPNPDNLPCVNHKDEDKLNNNVDNLEWCTYEYNLNYGTHTQRAKATKKQNGTDMLLYEYSCKNRDYLNQKIRERQCKQIAQIDKNTGEILKIYNSIKEAEEDNCCFHIGNCINNTRNESGGYIWQSIENIKKNKNCIVNAINRVKQAKYQNRKTMNKGKKIVQIDLNGAIVNKFNSIKEASTATGYKTYGISECLHDRQQTFNGFKWRFE